MAIFVQKDQGSQLTIFTAQGELSPQEIKDAIVEFYQDGATANTLWDMRQASLHHMDTEEIKRLARFIATWSPNRTQGKTAFLSSSEVDFGLTRMGEAYLQDLTVSYSSFRSWEEAMAWLAE